MPRFFTHTATVTLKLSYDMSLEEEIEALRAAGIPVNAMGNAEFGHLFVRRARAGDRPNIFRWFANGFEPGATDAAQATSRRGDDASSSPKRPQGPCMTA